MECEGENRVATEMQGQNSSSFPVNFHKFPVYFRDSWMKNDSLTNKRTFKMAPQLEKFQFYQYNFSSFFYSQVAPSFWQKFQ